MINDTNEITIAEEYGSDYIEYTMQIEVLNLNNRSSNALKRNGIFKLSELFKLTNVELHSLPGFGKETIIEVESAIATFFNSKKSAENFESKIKLCELTGDDYSKEVDYFDKKFVNRCTDDIDFVVNLRNMFSLYICSCEKQKTKINELSYKINMLPDFIRRYDLRLIYFIYGNQTSTLKQIIELNKIYSFDQLLSYLNNTVPSKILISFVNSFVDFLVEALQSKKYITTIVDSILADKKFKIIYEEFTNGGTLQSTANILGVTRERIRQLKLKFQRKFDSSLKTLGMLKKISIVCGSPAITEKCCVDIFGERGKSLYFLLKNSSMNSVKSNDNCAILCNGMDISALKKKRNELPTYFQQDFYDLSKYNCFEYFHDFVAKKLYYKELRGLYYKPDMTRNDIYDFMLLGFFNSGYKINNVNEYNELQNNAAELFGKEKLLSTIHAVDARTMKRAVLCNRGTYINSYFIDIQRESFDEIIEYIDNSVRTAFFYDELYDVFSYIFQKSKFDNKYYLHGLLKYYYPESYFFTRDTISKEPDVNTLMEIEKYIEEMGEVNRTEISNKFGRIADTTLIQMIARSEVIINEDGGIYFHKNTLSITDEDYAILDAEIEKHVKIRPCNSRKLYNEIKNDYSDFFTKNNIYTHTRLFSILKYKFEDKYSFSRPYISTKEMEGTTNVSAVTSYIKEHDIRTISQIMNFCKENQIHILSWTRLLSDISNQYIRTDYDEIYPLDRINIDGKLEEICELINKEMTSGYISLRKHIYFDLFPDVGVMWNSYLLRSIVQLFDLPFSLIDMKTSNFFVMNSFIVPKNSEYTTNIDIIKAELSGKSFSSFNEASIFLKQKCLIICDIPALVIQFINDNNLVDKENKNS